MTIGAALASGFTIPIYLRSQHHLPFALSCWAILGVIALILWVGLVRKNEQSDHVTLPLKLPLRNKRPYNSPCSLALCPVCFIL